MMNDEIFDYVIVGGGTAGCVLAARLSEDGRATVALIEAGGWARSPLIGVPAGFPMLLTGARYNWRFATEPEEAVCNRSIVVPRGKGLGGSSLINGMIFVRGQPADFDGWAQRGARGWSFAEVLPYFRRMESFAGGDPHWRGDCGPLTISRVRERPTLSEAFIDAAEQAGFARNPDYNAASQDGFGYYQVTQKNGRRLSVADSYLRAAARRPNLVIVTHALALSIALGDDRARSVTIRRGGSTRILRARREIILAAGAVQSPQLLELSGIGDPARLSALGIETRVAAPEVGENYQDHFATRMNWRVRGARSVNELSRGWRLLGQIMRYAISRTGVLSLGTGLAHGFVRTREGLEGPDVQYFFMHASYANAADRRLDTEPGMTIGVTQLRPESRGSIHARSPHPSDSPAIRPNFLAAAVDRKTMVDGMKIARRIIEQPAMERYRAFEMNPGPGATKDEHWLDFARRNGQTIYHPVGTCRMGADPGAVTDERLRVRGVAGLRVVDASVMPTLVAANTQAAVMMIAEKGADMIREDNR